jgi:hypothetical protein
MNTVHILLISRLLKLFLWPENWTQWFISENSMNVIRLISKHWNSKFLFCKKIKSCEIQKSISCCVFWPAHAPWSWSKYTTAVYLRGLFIMYIKYSLVELLQLSHITINTQQVTESFYIIAHHFPNLIYWLSGCISSFEIFTVLLKARKKRVCTFQGWIL